MTSSRPIGWEQLGDYKLLGKFAEGQSCVLRLALHYGAEQSKHALRAVKTPRPGLADDQSLIQLLVSEAQLLACVQHPNVVAAHGFGREPGGYVALDYVEGDDFKSLQAIGRTAPDPRLVAAIVADVLQGLDAVHDAVGEVGDPLRAVHQAPHARHILVSTDGRARLADFTHARVQRAASERRRPSRLEPAYRAPEQVLTPDQVDARTDLFVLGIAFWEALSGQSLFAAATAQQATQNVLTAPIPPPSQLNPQSPAALDRVCLRALERDPQARFGSAKDMLAALLDAALDIGGIALPAQVGRWVSVQAAAQLQLRRGLVGARATDSAPAPAAQTIPPPPAALDVRQHQERPRAVDLSKTLMGPGMGPSSGSQRPAAANPGLMPTVLAEPEPAFRPSRPPSSKPPGRKEPAAAGAQPNPAPTSSRPPPPTAMSHGDRPIDTIGTEGVEVERAVDAAPGTPASPVPPGARVRGRITEEYVATPRRDPPSGESPRPKVADAAPASVSVATAPSISVSAAPGAAASAAAPAPAARPAGTTGAANGSKGPELSPRDRVEPAPGRAAAPPGPPSSRQPAAPPAAPPRSTPPRSTSADFMRMTLFAVITVLLGDALIRSWFGSPYGAPRVAPVAPVRDPG
jgi:serine/threonine protein kinase